MIKEAIASILLSGSDYGSSEYALRNPNNFETVRWTVNNGQEKAFAVRSVVYFIGSEGGEWLIGKANPKFKKPYKIVFWVGATILTIKNTKNNIELGKQK